MPGGRVQFAGLATRIFRVWAPMTFLALVILIAVFGPSLLSDPHAMSVASRFAGPSLAHPLGADEFGRDILSRLASGAQLSLSVGFVSVAVASLFGIMIGVIAAYFGGLIGLAIASAACTAAQITLEWLAARYFVGVWCHASPFLIQDAVRSAETTPPPKESPL